MIITTIARDPSGTECKETKVFDTVELASEWLQAFLEEMIDANCWSEDTWFEEHMGCPMPVPELIASVEKLQTSRPGLLWGPFDKYEQLRPLEIWIR